jgi:DNA-binding MarR family transcriptional regulator
MRAQSLPTEPMREVLSYRISVLHALLTRRLALITSTSPLTTNQWKVLSVLFFWPDITAAGIVEVVVLDKAAISRAIASLVRLKLAQRRHDAENNNTVIAITAAGRKLYGEIHANICEMQGEILGEWNRSKQAIFFEALDQIEQSLR